MHQLQEPIFKGATRPAMKAGVPLVVLLAVFLPAILVSAWLTVLVTLWALPVVIAVLVPLYAWMRWVTYKDDQRLQQMQIKLLLVLKNRNRRLWKSRSYSSYRAREGK